MHDLISQIVSFWQIACTSLGGWEGEGTACRHTCLLGMMAVRWNEVASQGDLLEEAEGVEM